MVQKHRRAGPQDPMVHIKDLLPHVSQPTKNIPKTPRTSEEKWEEKVESEYKCSICHDAHFVTPLKTDGTPDYTRVVPCRCTLAEAAERRRLALLKWCELPKKTEHFTFENFKVTPKLKEAYDSAVEMAEGATSYTFLTLLGPSDRGKTHLLVSICRRWLERRQIARYAFVPILLDELRAGFRDGGDGSYEDRWQKFLNLPLLALDDLGTENPTPWVQERLDTLVDYRLVNGLFTVVTTNLLRTELPQRIASRLDRDGKIINMTAPAYSNVRSR